MIPSNGLKPPLQLLTPLGGVFDHSAFQEFQSSKGRSTADRIAAEGGGMAAARPGHHFAFSDHGSQGHAAGDALGKADDIRFDVPVLHGEHAPRPAHAGLHLIGHQQHAVLVAKLPQGREKARRRNVIAAFALDRLDEDGGHFVWRSDAFQHRVFDLPDTGALRRSSAKRTAAGKWHVMNVRHQRREATAMDDL